MQSQLPQKQKQVIYHNPDLYNPLMNYKAKLKAVCGGRCSGKSFAIASVLIEKALQEPNIHILCARVLKDSAETGLIGDIWETVGKLGYTSRFHKGADKIICDNGSEFHFQGTNGSPEELKSFNHYKYLWLEEAENISEIAFETIKTSIRGEGREIFCSWNPDSKNSPVWKHFMEEFYYKTEAEQNRIQGYLLDQDDNTYDFFYIVIQQNIHDLFEAEKRYSKEFDRKIRFVPADMRAEHARDLDVWGLDDPRYRNKWLGEPRDADTRYPFYGKYTEIEELPYELKIEKGQSYFNGQPIKLLGGQDYGYTTDPNALNIVFEYVYHAHSDSGFIKKRDLYIIDEVHLQRRAEAELLHSTTMGICPYIISCRTPIAADTSHQMFTDKLRAKYKWNIFNVKKPKRIPSGKNFIKARIDFILEYDNIYVLSKCKHTIEEFKLFSVKLNKDGKPTDDEFEDKNNHHIDALGYALTYYILRANNMARYDPDYEMTANGEVKEVDICDLLSISKPSYNAQSAVNRYNHMKNNRRNIV